MADERKPVAALQVGMELIAICDDGTVWRFSLVPTSKEWRPSAYIPPIPGTRAESGEPRKESDDG